MKVNAADLPPAGIGLLTLTLLTAGLRRSAAGIAIRSFLELTKTVVRCEPFQSATDPGTKFDPVIVTQVLLPGATALLGDKEEAVGAGFGTEDGGRTKYPSREATRPLPLPQKSFAVRNAMPLPPQANKVEGIARHVVQLNRSSCHEMGGVSRR